MRARLAAYDETGLNPTGVLPTIGLRFSIEVGGAGSLTFTALHSDIEAVGGWDRVLSLELEDGALWTPVALFAMRPPYTRRIVPIGMANPVDITATMVCQTWAQETVILPEYAAADMPPGAGEDRGIGWMGTAYDPAADPHEAWDLCYDDPRTARPPDWPTGSGAGWISATGSTDTNEKKYFRATLTVSGPGPVWCRAFFSSDESATVWVAGEPVIDWTSVEDGYKTHDTADLVLYPGSYAVGVATQSVVSKGGTGTDPILLAIATLDANGDPATWLLASSAATMVACRRDDQPPNDVPPGPTPGAVILQLLTEARDRNATGWAGVTADFTTAVDSYGQPWAATVVERQIRYVFDSMWAVWSALAETDEVDVWMGPDLVLHAAPEQRRDLTTPILTGTVIGSANVTHQPDPGTWAAGLAHEGWVSAATPGTRREYGLELGTAVSRPIAARVLATDLADVGRVDATIPTWVLTPGARPMLDLQPGDRLPIDWVDLTAQVRILSFAATAGDGGLLWEAELEVLP